MDNMITADGDQKVYWVVTVNGQRVTQPVTSQQLAEAEKMKLDADQQQSAMVVPVTSNGQQVLFD